jgi:ATP-binding cassette subfamily F protein 3
VAVVTFTEVRKSYQSQDVLRGASFFVLPGRKSGLIGPNGAGKTTILRLITGEETPDSGSVTLDPNARAAVLTQEPLLGDSRTVLDAAQRPTEALQECWAALTALESAGLEASDDLHTYDALHHRYQDLGGYDCENRAKEVLAGLGFTEESWDRPVSILSGGERTRLALVQILVLQPDLLLLDEPTNHIDWAASEWLQEYLRKYPGGALIVSHDRYFLDEVAEEIIELSGGVTRTYRGNYSAYLKRKALEREQAEEAFRRQQEEIARQQAIIQRLRSHRKFDSMHSREKTLEKLQADRAEKPRPDGRKMKVRVGEVARTGQEVLIGREMEHGFGGRTLYRGLTFTLARGERLAIVGPNGAGKTTLLRSLAGELTPLKGEVEYGFRVQPAYFAQDLSLLDPEATVWDTIWDTGALDKPSTIQALHQFLFVAEALEKPVAALSGGERTRLALCKLLVTRPNLLLLDEPTNHLDLPSREAVERAFRAYPGAMVVVSHDRYFLEAVATRILQIKPGAHRFVDGGYRHFREASPSAPAPAAPPRKASAPPPPRREKPVAPSRRLPKLEAEIARAEVRLKEITELLADAATWTNGKATALTAEYDTLTPQLETLYAEWAEVAELAAAG